MRFTGVIGRKSGITRRKSGVIGRKSHDKLVNFTVRNRFIIMPFRATFERVFAYSRHLGKA
jgi:hypothetical protein